MRQETSSAILFENKYRQDADPWNFEHSSYEQERYASILRAAIGCHYSRAFEPGCSIGVLTQKLAHLCDRLEAFDISPTAISNARQRCRDLTHVHIWCGSLPDAIPAGKFDLIMFSEIGYYFERGQLQEIVDRLAESLDPGGVFIAGHWLGTSADHVLSGDEVHRIIRECSQLSLGEEGRYAHSVLIGWCGNDATMAYLRFDSCAQRGGTPAAVSSLGPACPQQAASRNHL